MRSFNRFYLLFCFALLLLAPVLNDTFGWVQFARNDENRTFHDSLTIDINKLDKFPKDCEAYLADNFAFRTPFIRWSRSLKMNVFHVSPDVDRLLIGNNGRYFLAGEEKRIYEGDENFTPQQLDTLETEWLLRKRYFDERNIACYFVLAPSALEIYPEDLPSNIVRRFSYTRFDQVKSRFDRRLSDLFIDPRPALRNEKKGHNVYYLLDNHWNQRGAFTVAELVLQRMRKERFRDLDLAFLDQYTWKKERAGEQYLAELIGVKGLHEMIEKRTGYVEKALPAPKFGLQPPPHFVYPEYYELRFLNPKPTNGRKLLVIRDSFGDEVFPVLKEAFAETLVIFDDWQYGLNAPIVEAFQPDVVVYITYETHLKNQLKYR